MRIVILIGTAAFAMSADVPLIELGKDVEKRDRSIIRAMPDHMPIVQELGPVEPMPIVVPPDKPCDQMPIVVPPPHGIVRAERGQRDTEVEQLVER
jgi:hypothetical protein